MSVVSFQTNAFALAKCRLWSGTSHHRCPEIHVIPRPTSTAMTCESRVVLSVYLWIIPDHKINPAKARCSTDWFTHLWETICIFHETWGYPVDFPLIFPRQSMMFPQLWPLWCGPAFLFPDSCWRISWSHPGMTGGGIYHHQMLGLLSLLVYHIQWSTLIHIIEMNEMNRIWFVLIGHDSHPCWSCWSIASCKFKKYETTLSGKFPLATPNNVQLLLLEQLAGNAACFTPEEDQWIHNCGKMFRKPWFWHGFYYQIHSHIAVLYNFPFNSNMGYHHSKQLVLQVFKPWQFARGPPKNGWIKVGWAHHVTFSRRKNIFLRFEKILKMLKWLETGCNLEKIWFQKNETD